MRMRLRDAALIRRVNEKLDEFSSDYGNLPGIEDKAARHVFLRQLVESIHRVQYIARIVERDIALGRADPNSHLFDPLKAALLAHRAGEVEEAYWLIFLFVHFGKHARGGWRYVREIYGRLGDGTRWDWTRTSNDPSAFRAWLHAHEAVLKRSSAPGGFGNHRKYQSLDAYSATGTGAVVESYVRWIKPPRTHAELVTNAAAAIGDSRTAFRALYESMQVVVGFGRTACFDYLSMIGKIGLAQIQPDSTYLRGATGPLAGARLMFESQRRLSIQILESLADALADHLGVGMQVMEDALCNWQKSPNLFKPFRG